MLVCLLLVLAQTTEGFRAQRLSSGGNNNNNSNSSQQKHKRLQQLEDNNTKDDSRLRATTASTTSSSVLKNNKQRFKNFEEVLATYHEEPLMLIFTAVNCGPCKLMKQELKRASSLTGGDKFKMFSVDTNNFPHVGSRFQIAALPCLVLVQNGEPLLRIEGVLKAEEVVERIQTTILIE